MCDGITREQIATEREIANYKLSQYIMEITDGGKTLVSALVGIMEGNEPGTTPQDRIDAARELITRGRFIPAAADHIRTAETIIAQYRNPN